MAAAPPQTLVLDGAAGTYLESLNTPLHPELWSSGALLTPEGRADVQRMHRAYFDAGADVATSLTYQTSIAGLVHAGLSEQAAFDAITDAVRLARAVAREYTPPRKVAGGLGPYGSYLAGGQEYSGDYGATTLAALREFWLPRVRAVLAGEPDFLLFETVPNRTEIELLVSEAMPLARAAGVPVWFSLSVRAAPDSDAVTLADGTPVADLQPLFNAAPQIEAVGANCFDVRAVPRVIAAFSGMTAPLIVYPNSGEVYDGSSHTWSAPHALGREPSDWDPAAWARSHVAVIGGCCRTSPADIARVAEALR